jgi:hypothetical protein
VRSLRNARPPSPLEWRLIDRCGGAATPLCCAPFQQSGRGGSVLADPVRLPSSRTCRCRNPSSRFLDDEFLILCYESQVAGGHAEASSIVGSPRLLACKTPGCDRQVGDMPTNG